MLAISSYSLSIDIDVAHPLSRNDFWNLSVNGGWLTL